MDSSKPVYLQGVYTFSGSGLEAPEPIEGARYQVPYDKRSQLVYFRAGNSTDSLIMLVLLNNGDVIRYLPLGAKAAMHVALAVVEDLAPDTRIDLHVAAPQGVEGTVVVDIGFVEI